MMGQREVLSGQSVRPRPVLARHLSFLGMAIIVAVCLPSFSSRAQTAQDGTIPLPGETPSAATREKLDQGPVTTDSSGTVPGTHPSASRACSPTSSAVIARPSANGDVFGPIFEDPLLGVRIVLPVGYTAVEGPCPPVSALFRGPHEPPFRANINIIVEDFKGPVSEYYAKLGRLLPKGRTAPMILSRSTVSGRPALLLSDEFTHGLLPLRNIQTIVDAGSVKYVFTGTTLANRYTHFERLFRKSLETLTITARRPLPPEAGTVYVDPGGRFTWRLPSRFVAVKPPPPLVALFSGPVVDALPLAAEVRVILKPLGYDPKNVATTLKTLLSGGQRAKPRDRAALSGRVLPGGGLFLISRSFFRQREFRELAVRRPSEKTLLVATCFCPLSEYPLYERALTNSLMTLAPATPRVAPSAAPGGRSKPTSSLLPGSGSSPGPVQKPGSK